MGKASVSVFGFDCDTKSKDEDSPASCRAKLEANNETSNDDE